MVRKAARKGKKKRSGTASSTAQQVYTQAPLIRAFMRAKSSPRLRQEILTASPETVQAFSHIANNALNGSLVSPKKRALRARIAASSDLRGLASSSASLAKKRRILLQRGGKRGQKGGFLPILGALIPAAISLVSGLIGSRK